MFYSQNLLAKKGPFGTVWCAAHLQNRLKKPNYIAINIPATVEQIMNPPLPIALRMSGYLLFGVVRIYSKKVEYLQHDCNVLRIDISKAYANADINLPEDANQAKYDSITLPDNFALDLIDINDHDLNQSPDSHIRPNEDISFIDYTPVSFSKNRFGTPAGYIKISVGDDAFRSPINEDIPGPGYSPEISNPHTPPPTVDGVQDLDPNNHLESNFIDEDDVAPRETLRIHNSNHQKSPPVSSALPDTMEPDPVIVKAISEFNNIDSSNLKDIPDNSGPLSPLRQVTPQKIVHSENENDVVQDSFGQPSFELAPTSSREKRSAERAPFSLREKRPAELELSMMEDNDGTPSLRGTPDAGSLLPRTRCVAKLIKEKSAATPSSSECFGSVSMKNMLQGKTRKVCSRMFFETLVLKSCDLIDVKQDEPYGDISLKVTQKLSKLEFTN
ncbi:hypothetical protein QVD17_35121 [Tagetes erecta]|uniref:Sister chromatid cohesion 1 protein 3 n=1 Tax=Tagetes erecta TaxID=13708 RepID=A0AAD8JYS2_TARER|nr:hypothetical protein QVD17_35121 [Tagetes erecta]